jgi:methyl-accepting chemotaxis protein
MTLDAMGNSMPRLFQSLQAKVIAIFLALTAVSVAGLSVLSYVGSSTIFMDQTSASMKSILEFRASNLANQLHQIRDQASSLAKIEAVQQSMVNLKGGWKSLDKTPGDARKELQKYFVAENPNPPEKRNLLIKPEGPGGYYYSAHEALQPEVSKLLAASPFSDLLMADSKGNIFFTYQKGEAFAENATEPKLSATGLGKVYAQAVASVAKAEGDDIPGSFSGLVMNKAEKTSDVYVAVPIANLGVLRGIMIFKVRDSVLSQVLTMAIPEGSSEQTNIITSDGTVIGATPDGRLTLPDAAAYDYREAALSSASMTSAPFNRADGAATSFSMKLTDAGETYLISESVLNSELNAGAINIASLLAIFGIVVLAATSTIAWFILQRMFSPLAKLASATESVANGDLETVIKGEKRKDEMGTMSRALTRFRDSLIAQREMQEQAKSAEEADEAARLHRQRDERSQAESRERVVAALGQGLNQMAEGNLAFEISDNFPPELESLRHDFNSSAARLAEALTAIGENSTAISAGSDEMRQSADQLATRTERQTASISEAASAIDAITGTVKAQMARAEQATRMAKGATEGSEASAKIMEQTIQAMQAIQGSSQQINTIISVIDEIAFQTNLLALNAGVEAARAGESGKGFAVVAQEVRELAQRSAKAAKEISGLLNKSTGEVEVGVALVEKAGASLKAIATDVRAIGSEIEAMMLSTREESQSLGDINASISQIETMTQQNAAMVEETTAAIHKLAQEATEMDSRLGQFQLAAAAAQQWRRAS